MASAGCGKAGVRPVDWLDAGTTAGGPPGLPGADALPGVGMVPPTGPGGRDPDRPPASPLTDAAAAPEVPVGPNDALAADAGSAPDAPVLAPPPACGPCPSGAICIDGRCVDKGPRVAPELGACTRPPCINVFNNCPIPLWTHAVGTVPLDDGLVRRLGPGEQWQYAGLPEFGGGRLYAYYKEPASKQNHTRLVSDFNQFVEMTVDRDQPTGALAQNYNISYVDYLSLPVAMKAVGPGCAETKCGTRYRDWARALAGCPTELHNAHGDLAACLASYPYCITADGPATYDTTRPSCRKMQEAYGHPGSAIYGGVFPDRPATDVAFWDQVAAWNRGTFSGDADEANYYKTEPFNHYAGWIHEGLACPDVYAFSTDDHQDKAGFVRCVSPRLDVVWCPYETGEAAE